MFRDPVAGIHFMGVALGTLFLIAGLVPVPRHRAAV